MIEKDAQMRIYVDVCTLCRPYDDQSLMRIHLESDAFYLILQHVQNGNYTMIVSPVHSKEIEAIEDMRERLELTALLQKYGTNPSCNFDEIRKRAEQLYTQRFGIADASHVAFAEATSDVFITCDDKLLKKCQRSSVKILAMGPIDFCIAKDLR